MKEREVKAIKVIEKWLKEREIQQQESLVTEGTTLDASLVTKGITLDASLVAKQSTLESTTSLEQQNNSNSSKNEYNRSRNANRIYDNESSSLGDNAIDAEKTLLDTVASDIEYADIGPSYDSDRVFEVHHDTFENVFTHGIQTYEQHESIPDTYVVNETNNIIFDIPNMDPDRSKEEHDYVDYEKQRALFPSLINNLKCDAEKCTKTAQTLHILLPKEDSVHTGKQGLGFENKNNVENLFVLNKAKELAPSLYNIDEMGKEFLSDHKIISGEELKCEADKRLKEKQRKSPLSYHDFVYGET
ncbi:hypothetical protein Tco_0612458 [Tanacetum coccineum]